MQRYKMVVFIALCAAAILILVAAGISCRTKSRIDIDSFILKINEYYDDSFTYVSSGGQPWSAPYSEIIMSSEKLNGQLITFQVSDQNSFSDNYIPVKYKEKVEDVLEGIAVETFGNEVAVINAPGKQSLQRYTSETTFEEYCEGQAGFIVCAVLATVDLENEDVEADVESLRAGLEKAGMQAMVYIYLYDGTPVREVEILNSSSFSFRPEADSVGILNLNDDFSVKDCVWR